MAYRTIDELGNFDFTDAQIYEIREYHDQLIFDLGYVTIRGTNSCNRDVRDMGTNELRLILQKVSNKTLILEGYKLFDADGNLKGKYEDEIILPKDYHVTFKELENSSIYALEQTAQEYRFYIDTSERTYSFTVTAEHDAEEWERFMNKTPSY